MSPLERFLCGAEPMHVGADGQMRLASSGLCPPSRVILPGSFNPIHQGHWQLARAAEQLLGDAAAFEISVANVDKPPLTQADLRARLRPFNWQASVWLTHAPRFTDKSLRFPGATFVIGADTAARVVSPRYYDDSVARMRGALSQIAERNCRFLVACRVDARGQCIGLSDLAIPSAFRAMFDQIPHALFRWDISSTELRSRDRSRSSLAGN